VTVLVGVTIHDPDVAFTDLGLAILGAYLGWRLWRAPGRDMLRRTGAILMGGLASAAFWGAVFHAFFPAGTATSPGLLAWVPVVLSIVVAASAMLDLSLRLLLPRMQFHVRRSIVAAYAVAFAVVALLVHESFSSIVYFYTPALLLLLIAAGQEAIRSRDSGWTLIATGLIISAGAAVLQQAKVAVHPVHFDHNAVYHVVQGIALVFLYFGYRRAPRLQSVD
jgi:cation transport ATPase